MARPVLTRDPSEQVTVLSRMLRQVDIDPRYKPRRRRVLKEKITALLSEFQKEVNAQDNEAAE